MQKRLIYIFAGALVVAAGLIGFLILQSSPTEPTSMNQEETPPTPTRTVASVPKLIIGSKSAPITIIEYGDYQCPICKRFFEQTEPELRKTYIDSGRAKIEFRVETHIGEESAQAGEAAYCANDQGKFSQYHDALYEEQSFGNSGVFSYQNLKQIAAQLGLETKKFADCLDSGKYTQVVIEGNRQAQAKINSTPTFFIGDQVIVGAQPFGIFKAVLEAQ